MRNRKRTERKESWKEKILHWQANDIASEDRWLWLKQGNVKSETESLIFAARTSIPYKCDQGKN